MVQSQSFHSYLLYQVASFDTTEQAVVVMVVGKGIGAQKLIHGDT